MNTWFYIAVGLYVYALLVLLLNIYLMKRTRQMFERLSDLIKQINGIKKETEKP